MYLIVGDINTDLAIYDTHSAATDYVHMLICNNFLPLSVMPTRIIDTSATDHIYYYKVKKKHKERLCN